MRRECQQRAVNRFIQTLKILARKGAFNEINGVHVVLQRAVTVGAMRWETMPFGL
jgi:hypothetical protein